MQFESQIQSRISKLEEELENERKKFIDEKLNEDWKKFLFFSFYRGSHTELGEGDEWVLYLFHPYVDFSQWKDTSFSHGHFGQSEDNASFEIWLAGIPDDFFVEMDPPDDMIEGL